jgi:uncharacterized membrane protein
MSIVIFAVGAVAIVGIFVYVLYVIFTEPNWSKHKTTQEDREALELLMERIREGRKAIDAQEEQESEPKPENS